MKKLFLIAALALSTLVVHAQYNMSETQIQFQSTSSMPASGSKYASAPTIGENGTATYNGASYSPNRVGLRRTNSGDNAGTPGGKPDPGNQQPIGDVPYLFMAILFIGYCLFKVKEKTVSY